MAVSWPLPIFNTINTLPSAPSDFHSCSKMFRERLARLENVAEESLQRKILTMQVDGSVFVSDLAVVFVFVLAHSLVNVARDGRVVALSRCRVVAHIYSAQSQHDHVRLPTTTHVPKCYESDSRDNTFWQWRAYSERYSSRKLSAVLSYQNLQYMF